MDSTQVQNAEGSASEEQASLCPAAPAQSNNGGDAEPELEAPPAAAALMPTNGAQEPTFAATPAGSASTPALPGPLALPSYDVELTFEIPLNGGASDIPSHLVDFEAFVDEILHLHGMNLPALNVCICGAGMQATTLCPACGRQLCRCQPAAP
ncbi:hypothetical protein MKEN_00227800 [Mycena kentingensis (nom. inval.)]|nr:hypothetical protein MKEN_00227800 [Mycena kentingensis (nom. inval.)]